MSTINVEQANRSYRLVLSNKGLRVEFEERDGSYVEVFRHWPDEAQQPEQPPAEPDDDEASGEDDEQPDDEPDAEPDEPDEEPGEEPDEPADDDPPETDPGTPPVDTSPPPATGGAINPPLPPIPVSAPTVSATKTVSNQQELLAELKAARGGEVFKIDADIGALTINGVSPASPVTVICRDFDSIKVANSANLTFTGAKRTAKAVAGASWKRLWDVLNSSDIQFLDNTIEGDVVQEAGSIYDGFGGSWLFYCDNAVGPVIDGLDAYRLQHGPMFFDGVDGVYRNFHTHELREDSWRCIGMDGMLIERGLMTRALYPESDPKHPDLGGQMFSARAKRPNDRSVDGGDLTQGFFWAGWKASDGIPRWGILDVSRVRVSIPHRNALSLMGFQFATLTDIELVQKLTDRKSYTDLLQANGGKYSPDAGLFKPQLSLGDVPEVHLTRVVDAVKAWPDGRAK